MHSHRFVPYVLLAVLGCTAAERDARAPSAHSPSAHSPSAHVIDAFGDTLFAGAPLTRIASLNPVTAELVFAIGAGGRLVGRTHWDTWPDSARLVPDLGDGMRPNVEVIMAAHPDLVLLYASAENRAARDAFRRNGIQTLTQRIDRVGDFASAVMQLGQVLGDTVRAAVVRDSVLASLERARARTAGLRKTRVLWALWEAPLMAVGHGSFLNDLLDAAGAENIFGDVAAPSPQVTFEEVVRRDPDVILIGPQRAPALRIDPRWRALRAVRDNHVFGYDTLIVSRPGVRLGEAAMYLAELLHPELRAK